jgi:hypothetical protein
MSALEILQSILKTDLTVNYNKICTNNCKTIIYPRILLHKSTFHVELGGVPHSNHHQIPTPSTTLPYLKRYLVGKGINVKNIYIKVLS